MLVFFMVICFSSVACQIYDESQLLLETTTAESVAEGEKKMSEYILKLLDHYQQPDPLGLPGLTIPDSYPVPDTKLSKYGAILHLKNTKVYGINKFRIVYVNAEIAAMEVELQLNIDELQARGDYTISTWISWNTEISPFSVVLTDLKATAFATLEVARDGKLRAKDIEIDLTTKNMHIMFKNMNSMGSLFQGFINTAPTLLFNSFKPYILKEIYPKVREEINKRVENLAGYSEFPNSIAPLDIVVAELRKYVRNMKFDPLKIRDYDYTTAKVFTIILTNTWLMGLSSFQRVGNIIFRLENTTLVADLKIGTQKLEGTTQWHISGMGGLLTKSGTATFSVEYINVRIILAQQLDTRQKTDFRDFGLEIGNIQMRCDGAGIYDYVIELAVNILPNVLRYQIVDAVEDFFKDHIQIELNELDVQDTIEELLPKIDALSQHGFPSISTEETAINSNRDEFFDF